ncbi:B-box type zinc finger protein ncl-1-like [Limulus polyphemus]|uniref:B-box type zinc finger protein ncl-1-like n=1 Tax=Limulus polyphemus TaxID=6850 RepID=A0ABM1T639_LIMPO|nr:B-box type zinc finger protein ncl-1-like [Limulus polyphemus]XP_022251346.1 B-box type zinc finger protein ncl-1-like [Limulus polyphemus]XP_022251347.1 B-box type zinc finger protein ncl-1-like [Limulus polyphemus]XP_022251348.1 B-box type zinc finger protein ncl-1-like [Limulus polyphemus]XP_022251349.1 B-box type zinc finger protein ncl-1-like [Limulus polyphemus]XP_022251350.1 B-box type zinc finger protein ncl-1-like [Limulus polyphemus]
MASPTLSLPESTAFSTTSASADHSLQESLPTKCPLCQEVYTIPKVLPCLHTFCQHCLEKIQESPDKIKCPHCQEECLLTTQGVSGLLSDYAISNILEVNAMEATSLCCTGCRTKENNAVARCFDCANFLCSNCVMAHQFMHCFEGHRVLTLGELQSSKDDRKLEKPIFCSCHKYEILEFFCQTCNVLICKDCIITEHPKGLHNFDHLAETGHKQVEFVGSLIEDSRLKKTDLQNLLKTIEHSSNNYQIQYEKAQNEIKDTHQFYCSVLQERKKEILKDLDDAFNSKIVYLSLLGQNIQENIDKTHEMCDFVEKMIKFSSKTEILMFKQLLTSKFQKLVGFNPAVELNTLDLKFVSNYQTIQIGVRNTFGYLRQNSELLVETKPQSIARPNGVIGSERSHQNGHMFDSNGISKRSGSTNTFGSFLTNLGDLNSYEKWSSAPSDIFQNGSETFPISSDTLFDLSSKLFSSSIFPLKSQIKRQKMIYYCKFGEFGVMEGQFTEPSGVAVNVQSDIIVADTNNHRIQIFDKEGRFKFQFGECGKRDGQLLYPNRVAVVKASGDIIVTERSPTHQIQIYNQYGQFVRKFGANILQHPRGVTVDNKGRIIVVECKVMRVIIFDLLGNVHHKFGCSKHLEFPNGVVVNDKQEIFISDNRAHCVKVFNYEGIFLWQIGREGITNYPIGVCISPLGEILVADNHNNFNITIFTQDGQLVSALESKVKHAQCFDVALVDDGSVVLASKDYRLYVYRFL